MDHSSHGHGAATRPDSPAGHGMIVLGFDTIFLSHLPMFMRLHDYEVVLQASFGPFDSIYRDDGEANPRTRLYTFAPQKFVLPDLFPGPNGEPPRSRSFVGSLVRNHFEQPPAHPEEPVEIASDVVVEVINVVHQHKFDPKAEPLE